MRFCTLASGSSGNCLLVEDGDTRLLIDCGIGIRTLKQKLEALHINLKSLDAVLVTHEHSDHIKAIAPLAHGYGMPIIGPRAAMMAMLGKYADLLPDRFQVFDEGMRFRIGSVTVTPYPLPHDSCGAVGYLLEGAEEKRLSVSTDLGHVTPEAEEAMRRSDFAVIECNYDRDALRDCSYPYILKHRILSDEGHLQNEDCAALCAACASDCRHFVLFHLSENSNTPALALGAVTSALEAAGYRPGDISVDLAPRHETSGWFVL